MVDMMQPLSILYQDEFLVAVSKPSGMLVHRGMGAQTSEPFLLQTLRDQLGSRLFPVHRLDRPTAGIVLFALSSDMARDLQAQWQAGKVRKTYHAIVRGWMPTSEGLCDEALDHPDTGVLQEARSRWRELERATVPLAVGPYPESRYSFLELEPLTGRTHQLRRHMARLKHPILGDTTHGDRHHNHALRDHLGWWRLLLAAVALRLDHPRTGAELNITDDPANGIEPYWRLLTRSRPSALA